MKRGKTIQCRINIRRGRERLQIDGRLVDLMLKWWNEVTPTLAQTASSEQILNLGKSITKMPFIGASGVALSS